MSQPDLERRIVRLERRLDRLEGRGGLLERMADTLDEHTGLLRDMLTLFHSLDERTARIEAYLRPPGANGPPGG